MSQFPFICFAALYRWNHLAYILWFLVFSSFCLFAFLRLMCLFLLLFNNPFSNFILLSLGFWLNHFAQPSHFTEENTESHLVNAEFNPELCSREKPRKWCLQSSSRGPDSSWLFFGWSAVLASYLHFSLCSTKACGKIETSLGWTFNSMCSCRLWSPLHYAQVI